MNIRQMPELERVQVGKWVLENTSFFDQAIDYLIESGVFRKTEGSKIIGRQIEGRHANSGRPPMFTPQALDFTGHSNSTAEWHRQCLERGVSMSKSTFKRLRKRLEEVTPPSP